MPVRSRAVRLSAARLTWQERRRGTGSSTRSSGYGRRSRRRGRRCIRNPSPVVVFMDRSASRILAIRTLLALSSRFAMGRDRPTASTETGSVRIVDFRSPCCRGTDWRYVCRGEWHFVKCQSCRLIRLPVVRPRPPTGWSPLSDLFPPADALEGEPA